MDVSRLYCRPLIGALLGLGLRKSRVALVSLVIFCVGLFVWNTSTGIPDDLYEAGSATALSKARSELWLQRRLASRQCHPTSSRLEVGAILGDLGEQIIYLPLGADQLDSSGRTLVDAGAADRAVFRVDADR